ncbi:Tartrate-resistant acid phosphatase type 5 [Aphelenchoides besseyi]|nr:Tartrate-resistant acid phosphatase type 5 [Aphelenchoides besseyi]
MDVGIRWHETKVVTYQFGLLIFTHLLKFTIESSVDSRSLTPRDRTACIDGRVCHLDKDYLDFFVIGDTGVNSLGLALDFGTNYLNFIKATELQQRLARSMADLAGRQKPEFIINTGDNVHFNGVDDTMDSRFETVFEEVYSDDRLLVPFYMIAVVAGKFSVEVVFLDIRFIGHTQSFTTKLLIRLLMEHVLSIYCSLTQSFYVETRLTLLIVRYSRGFLHDAECQIDRIKNGQTKQKDNGNGLINSSEIHADYLFVVGYYPIYSITFNGNTQCLVEKLDPMLRKYQVSAYISGYDHNIQFFRVDNTTDPQATSRTYGHHSRHKEKFVGRPNYYRRGVSTMHYLVSGAGSRLDGSTANLDHVPVEPIFHFPKRHDIPTWKRIFKAPELGYGAGGFVRFEIRNDTADLYFYVRDLELQFLDYINRRPAIAELKDRRRKKTRKKVVGLNIFTQNAKHHTSTNTIICQINFIE